MFALAPRSYLLLLNTFTLFVGLGELAYAALLPHDGRAWIVADWLINYQGGFVRRGLPGEVLYRLHQWLHLPLVLSVSLVCMALTLALVFGFWLLARRSQGELWAVAVVISPATLAFPLQQNSFHKEILYLALFTLFMVWLRRPNVRASWVSMLLLVSFPLLVLSHETLLLYLPYFLAGLIVSGRSLKDSFAVWLPGAALAAAAAAITIMHPGNGFIATQICRSLGYPPIVNLLGGVEICNGGAIMYLALDAETAQKITRYIFATYHYLRLYPVLAVLSILPLVIGGTRLFQIGFTRGVRTIAASAFVSCAGASVLFVYSTDWGRWIYIQVMSVAVLLLFLDGQRAGTAHDNLAHKRPLAAAAPAFRYGLGLLLFLYATVWSLPGYFASPSYSWGYLGLAQSLEGRVTAHMPHGSPPSQTHVGTSGVPRK